MGQYLQSLMVLVTVAVAGDRAVPDVAALPALVTAG